MMNDGKSNRSFSADLLVASVLNLPLLNVPEK
jgi:hypothetical protein